MKAPKRLFDGPLTGEMAFDQPPLLSVRDLSVSFDTREGRVVALDHVRFTMQRRERVGIVGESGSGKSVFAHALMGILDRAARVDSGEIVFEGARLLHLPPSRLDEIRGRELSIIFQQPRLSLDPILTVGRQIGEVLGRHDALPRDKWRARAAELLRLVRISDPERRLDQYPFELSGGMCQRVMIAMAISCRPSLLLADEPTTGLDVTTQASILATLADLARETGLGVVLITHDLAVAASFCQRLVVMHAGHVVETGPSAALLARPRHPYTRGLLAASASFGDRNGIEDLCPIAGSLPDLRGAPPGCRFKPRCPMAGPECDAPQAMRRVAPEHFVLCGRAA